MIAGLDVADPDAVGLDAVDLGRLCSVEVAR